MWEEAFERKRDASEQARGDLEKISTLAKMEPRQGPINYASDFYPRIMEALFASNSWLAIVMIPDLRARRERFNVPGMAHEGNWTRRMHATIAELRHSRTTRERMRLIRELL